MGNSIKYTEINWYGLKLPRQTMTWCPNRVAWGKLGYSLGWGTSPTKTPSKLYSTLRINPYKWTFPNCDISCIMVQSTNKTTNENDFTSSVWEKLYCSGSRAVCLATNYSMGYTQDGHNVSWCLFWSSVLEKSIEFSFHTFIKSWWIDKRHLFQLKDIHIKQKEIF